MARLAGVSVATVSHVVNSTRYVSPELSERVRTVMAEIGYRPNGTARSLRLQRTQTIGLVVPDINPFFAELARIIEDEGFAAGYTTVLGNADGRPERERRYVETLLSKQVDGLILGSTLADATTLVSLVGRSGTPLVLIDRDLPAVGADIVLADHAGGAYALTRHLLELGHRRIACITGPERLPSSEGRAEGYHRALEEFGIESRPEWLAPGAFEFGGGRRAMARLLEADPGLTAVFATNDLMAVGAMRELAERGLRVPQDVSVGGFDDAMPATLISPELTTVRQPLQEMGREAVEMLRARMDGDSGEARRIVLAAELVPRKSAGPVRRRRPAATAVGARTGTGNTAGGPLGSRREET